MADRDRIIDHYAAAHAAGIAAYRELDEELDAGGCACEDCVVREVLNAALPELRAIIAAELAEEAGDTPRT